ncbi:MAG: hypothetical protein WDN04_24180 [Rhodospirillales bacterium]
MLLDTNCTDTVYTQHARQHGKTREHEHQSQRKPGAEHARLELDPQYAQLVTHQHAQPQREHAIEHQQQLVIVRKQLGVRARADQQGEQQDTGDGNAKNQGVDHLLSPPVLLSGLPSLFSPAALFSRSSFNCSALRSRSTLPSRSGSVKANGNRYHSLASVHSRFGERRHLERLGQLREVEAHAHRGGVMLAPLYLGFFQHRPAAHVFQYAQGFAQGGEPKVQVAVGNAVLPGQRVIGNADGLRLGNGFFIEPVPTPAGEFEFHQEIQRQALVEGFIQARAELEFELRVQHVIVVRALQARAHHLDIVGVRRRRGKGGQENQHQARHQPRPQATPTRTPIRQPTRFGAPWQAARKRSRHDRGRAATARYWNDG